MLAELTEQGIVWIVQLKLISYAYDPFDLEDKARLGLDFYQHRQGIASDWAESAVSADQRMIDGLKAMSDPTTYQ